MVRTQYFHCQGLQVRCLVRELRSHKPHSTTKQTNKCGSIEASLLLKVIYHRSRPIMESNIPYLHGITRNSEERELKCSQSQSSNSPFGKFSSNTFPLVYIFLESCIYWVPTISCPSLLETYSVFQCCHKLANNHFWWVLHVPLRGYRIIFLSSYVRYWGRFHFQSPLPHIYLQGEGRRHVLSWHFYFFTLYGCLLRVKSQGNFWSHVSWVSLPEKRHL